MAKGSPFGKESRVRLLKQHFDASGPFTAADAWRFVYEELLWIDGSTGLAHLYESDKAQPGRSLWYERSITFTNWLCEKLGTPTRTELKARIDRLFRACLEKLVESKKEAADAQEVIQAVAEAGRETGLPEQVVAEAEEAVQDKPETYVPDVDLVAEFAILLAQHTALNEAAAMDVARQLVAKARYYFTVERKRQNVLGEGFEDLLHLLALRVGKVPSAKLIVRQKADKLPGFAKQSQRERVESPDLAIVEGERTDLLASIKWSLRQDRQKQLSDELDCFVDIVSQEKFPTYILVTNEYDPGRLINTAGLARRGQKIDSIYHINLELLKLALADHPKLVEINNLIASKHLRSLEDLLNEWAVKYGRTGNS